MCLQFFNSTTQAISLIKMSSNNNNNARDNVAAQVPVLDGTNYRVWSSNMKAYLQAHGVWRIVDGSVARPTDAVEAAKWDVSDDIAQGNIVLRLAHNCCNEVGTTSAATWTNLETAFGSVGISQIFGDFCSLVSFKISGSQHPGAEITRFNTAVERLKANSVNMPDHILGMMVLSVLPPRWDHVSAIYLQGKTAITEVKYSDIRSAIVAEFDRVGSSQQQHAHKITAIKHKGEHPRYSNQRDADSSPANDEGRKEKSK